MYISVNFPVFRVFQWEDGGLVKSDLNLFRRGEIQLSQRCGWISMRNNINEVMFGSSGEPIRNEIDISVNFPVFLVFRKEDGELIKSHLNLF